MKQIASRSLVIVFGFAGVLIVAVATLTIVSAHGPGPAAPAAGRAPFNVLVRSPFRAFLPLVARQP